MLTVDVHSGHMADFIFFEPLRRGVIPVVLLEYVAAALELFYHAIACFNRINIQTLNK